MSFLPLLCRLAAAALPTALGVLAVPGTAHALTIRCVATSQQLNAAIAEANASTDSTFWIRLHQGVYHNSSGAFWFDPVGSGRVIELSGGWSGANGSCTTKHFKPGLTVIHGTSTQEALAVSMDDLAGQQQNTVYINDVTLTNAGLAVAGLSACFFGMASGPGMEIVMDRIHLRGCRRSESQNASMFLDIRSGALATLRNFYVRDGAAPENGGIGVVARENAVVRLAHFTVTATESLAPASGLGSGIELETVGNGVIHLGNSVTWGNDPDADIADLRIRGAGVHLYRVHYGDLDGTPASSFWHSSGNPGFMAPDNARLRPDSVLVDTGHGNPHAGMGTYDADGVNRMRGVQVDVGAFEADPGIAADTLFQNGFQPVPWD